MRSWTLASAPRNRATRSTERWRACGVRADSIRDVFVTHMHPDHIGLSGTRAADGAAIHLMRGEERRARYVWSPAPLDAWVDFMRSPTRMPAA